MRLPISLSLFLLLVPACTSDTNGDPTGTTNASSEELAVCRALMTASRTFTSRCSPFKPTDEAGDAEAACADVLHARGTRLDLQTVRACTTALEAMACDGDIPEACKATPGALVDGTACISGAQCLSEHCTGTDQGCGRCAESAKEGEPCELLTMAFGGGCRPDLRCAWVMDAQALKVRTRCVERPGPRSCERNAESCAEGLRCDIDSTSEYGHCVEGLSIGSACGEGVSRRCSFGLSCIEGTCRARGERDEACSTRALEQSDVVADTCADGLACDLTSRTCSDIVQASPGAACDGGTQQCENGFCETGRCYAFLRVGQPCDASDVRQRCGGTARCIAGTCRRFDAEACRD